MNSQRHCKILHLKRPVQGLYGMKVPSRLVILLIISLWFYISEKFCVFVSYKKGRDGCFHSNSQVSRELFKNNLLYVEDGPILEWGLEVLCYFLSFVYNVVSIYYLKDSCTCTGLYFGINLQPKSFFPSLKWNHFTFNLALIW